jgi:hypothetical protein
MPPRMPSCTPPPWRAYIISVYAGVCACAHEIPLPYYGNDDVRTSRGRLTRGPNPCQTPHFIIIFIYLLNFSVMAGYLSWSPDPTRHRSDPTRPDQIDLGDWAIWAIPSDLTDLTTTSRAAPARDSTLTWLAGWLWLAGSGWLLLSNRRQQHSFSSSWEEGNGHEPGSRPPLLSSLSLPFQVPTRRRSQSRTTTTTPPRSSGLRNARDPGPSASSSSSSSAPGRRRRRRRRRRRTSSPRPGPGSCSSPAVAPARRRRR